ncbi:MAG: hypothetical protein M3063_15800 [Actinomycetota bacterium]|nr:hypothetical protein [Actinomycetota bacterium]
MADHITEGSGSGQARPGLSPMPEPPEDRTGPLRPALGLLVGIGAILPVLVGPRLSVARDVEIADHVIPGLVVLAVSAIVLVMGRRSPMSEVSMLGLGLVMALAGLWMTATHLPLVVQAVHDEAPWWATIFHSASAVLVLAFALMWVQVSWADAQ